MAFQETFERFLVGIGADLRLQVTKVQRGGLFLGNISVVPRPSGKEKVELIIYSKKKIAPRVIGPFPEADFSKKDSATRKAVIAALQEYI